MKTYMALAAIAAFGCAFAAPAFAQTNDAPKDSRFADEVKPVKKSEGGFYAGAAINMYYVDSDYAARGLPVRFKDQPSPAALMGRVGYAFNRYIAIEGELGIGGAKQKYAFDTSGSDVDGHVGIKSPMGARLVAMAPLGGSLYLMGSAGYASAKITRDFRGAHPADLDVSGPTFGAGAGFRSGSVDFRMNYSFMSGGDSGDGGVLGISVDRHF